jgi:PTH1 family peptidyl-tRNA hydrolase
MFQLVVGLGNPGREYVGTRHNVGFAVLDGLAERFGCSFKSKARFDAEVAEVSPAGGRVLLAKPVTFMNRSGSAVVALANWLKIEPGALLVVVDDADLPLGRMKVLASGGSGGHNGLRSIIEAFGGVEGFARVRVGIGRSAPTGAGIANHVLGKFSAAELPQARQAVERAVAAVTCALAQGLPAAMNEFNRKVQEGEQS